MLLHGVVPAPDPLALIGQERRSWGGAHGQGLAEVLSGGRSRRDRREPVRVGARGSRGELRQIRIAARLFLHGPSDHVHGARRPVGNIRRLPAGARPRQGSARRADDAEHPPISGLPVRHAARRMHGRQCQSALHRARARASADRQRRRSDRRRREFRPHAGRSARQDEDQACRRDQYRRNARHQGPAGRLRAAPREESWCHRGG